MKNEKQKFLNRKQIIIIVLFIIFIVFMKFYLQDNKLNNNTYYQENSSSFITDNEAIDWNGKRPLDTYGENEKIGVPCFDSLVFTNNNLVQKVNIYNPASNNCFMIFSITVDDNIIWKSNMVEPSKGFYEIELNKNIQSGKYEALLIIDCFDNNGQPLNSAVNKFNLYVK